MPFKSTPIPVITEVGKKRTFASALDWPGWARSGRNESEALHNLLAYSSRYLNAIRLAPIEFQPPTGLNELMIIKRLPGNSTTDFGAPGIMSSDESKSVDTATLIRLQDILNACWRYFGAVAGSASGKNLRKGPRGGGRTAGQIIDHVIESHYSYLRMIYWREPFHKENDINTMIEKFINIDEQALAFAISGKMPETGPRGGVLWKPRYFIRRSAWHILDHAWEIEDRIE